MAVRRQASPAAEVAGLQAALDKVNKEKGEVEKAKAEAINRADGLQRLQDDLQTRHNQTLVQNAELQTKSAKFEEAVKGKDTLIQYIEKASKQFEVSVLDLYSQAPCCHPGRAADERSTAPAYRNEDAVGLAEL